MIQKILVIEDEDIASQRLISLLKRKLPESEVIGPLESVQQSIHYLKNNPHPDLIFLDIQLADGMSFEIFDEVQVQSPVIFTTAYDEYALKAFSLNSIDYLLKPIHEEKLDQAIQKCLGIKNFYLNQGDLSQLKQIVSLIKNNKVSYKTRFLISKGDMLIPVHTNEIAYFLAEDKIVWLITTENKKYIINYTLDSLEECLDPEVFFRVNRHCLISLQSVHKIHSYFNYKLKIELIPECPEEIIISKSRTSEFKHWMNN